MPVKNVLVPAQHPSKFHALNGILVVVCMFECSALLPSCTRPQGGARREAAIQERILWPGGSVRAKVKELTYEDKLTFMSQPIMKWLLGNQKRPHCPCTR